MPGGAGVGAPKSLEITTKVLAAVESLTAAAAPTDAAAVTKAEQVRVRAWVAL